MFKFFDGGSVPMLIGAALIAAMLIWSHGSTAVMAQYSTQYGPFETEWPQLKPSIVPRVPGSAVFLADSRSHAPPVLVHYVERSRSLHETVVLLQVIDEPQPEITSGPRYTLERLGDGFYFVAVRFGCMEQPLLVPFLRKIAVAEMLPLDPDTATLFIGHSEITPHEGGRPELIPDTSFAYSTKRRPRGATLRHACRSGDGDRRTDLHLRQGNQYPPCLGGCGSSLLAITMMGLE